MKDEQELLEQFIVRALEEDVGPGDYTSLACIPPDSVSQAKLLVKDAGVISGVDIAERIFMYVDPDTKFDQFKGDGEDIIPGDIAFTVTCNTQALLKVERLVLNTMQRMSGITTLSSRFAFEVADLPVTILDTRKTTPLIRFLEKWAVEAGGCTNYRIGLFDWIMIKDNHIDACGSISKAIDKVHAYFRANSLELGITVEVRNLVELHEVLAKGGVTRIMFDNFEIPILAEAVATVGNRFETEASGGINLSNVRRYAETGVQFISVGALTHSAESLDLSLKVMQ